LLNHFMI